MENLDVRNAQWFKSTYSNGNCSCIEVALLADAVAVRDTKEHGAGPVLTSTAEAWRAFVAGVVRGDFGEV